MNNGIFSFQPPLNEPVMSYEKGSPERMAVEKELIHLSSTITEIPLIINGKEIHTKKKGNVVMPHNHNQVIARYSIASETEIESAVNAAIEARQKWMTISWVERASIMMKAAELISKKYRATMVAATMLGQSKSVHQAEIDAACETVDFLRFNSFFAAQIYEDQPRSSNDQLNRLEYRPLEGFVYAITPFNFTAIASNLNMSVALMGNTTVWKPATTSLLSNYFLMKIFLEAGLPAGVVNFIPGSGSEISRVVLRNSNLAGIHFTGSNATFNTLWKGVSENIEKYKSYPKLVGETGGKDFIFVHNSANKIEVATAIIRGAFEYQGQKCSAASRAYIPASCWPKIKDHLLKMISRIKVGDVSNFSNFVNAVIDENSFNSIMEYIEYAVASPDCEIIAGGKGDKCVGYFIEPTIIVTKDPHFKTMEEEIFGPVMTIYVYNDDLFEETLHLCDSTSPYGLTGSIFSNDRYAAIRACQVLRYAAGNFYYNDKPTGAMVGMQPFGGARASGTNDKAGGQLNLLRWTSPRTIKETFLPATDFPYPSMY